MIIEVDSRSCEAAIDDIRKIPHLHNVNFSNKEFICFIQL